MFHKFQTLKIHKILIEFLKIFNTSQFILFEFQNFTNCNASKFLILKNFVTQFELSKI